MSAKSTRVLVERLLPARPAPVPLRLAVDPELERLERRLVDPRWTLQCVGPGDYEARTFAGDVGRGTSPGAAIAALSAVLP